VAEQPTPPAPDHLVTRDGLGRFAFWQPRRGYRFSIDSVLLAAFATPAAGAVADLGAGCGVLSVLLAARGLAGPFTAVEIDPLAASCCRANLEAAGVAGRVLEADISAPLEDLKAGGFSLVVSNPPFTRAGHGRVSPRPERARARQELALSAPRLWEQAARLLPRGGRLALCWPPARLVEAMQGLPRVGLTPKRLRLVHGRTGKPASLALLEAVRGGGSQLTVEPPLVVYAEGQEYSPEVKSIYAALDRP